MSGCAVAAGAAVAASRKALNVAISAKTMRRMGVPSGSELMSVAGDVLPDAIGTETRAVDPPIALLS